jgi:hypothetical protein
MAAEVKARSCRVKNVGAHSGRSASSENPKGLRRRGEGGKELAPGSLRAAGRVFMSDCTPAELARIGLGEE